MSRKLLHGSCRHRALELALEEDVHDQHGDNHDDGGREQRTKVHRVALLACEGGNALRENIVLRVGVDGHRNQELVPQAQEVEDGNGGQCPAWPWAA